MKQINTAIIGLGRLGREHAKNLAFKIPNCNLTSACSIVESELDFAKNELGIDRLYENYQKLLETEKPEAVVLVTPTEYHADQIIQALENGCHVFCEKPLAIKLEDCFRVKSVYQHYQDLILQIGFVRRYDESYEYAKKQIEAGDIGTPFHAHAETADMNNTAAFQIEFTQLSGGIFHDMNIHDIDLVQWLTQKQIKSVYALGGCFMHKGFEKYQDADNSLVLCELAGGGMATIGGSRTNFHGHDTYTMVKGTQGYLEIGKNPNSNRIRIFDEKGVRSESVMTFFDRFKDAFYRELSDFFDCITKKQSPRITIEEATSATNIATKITQSYREKSVVSI